MAIETPSEIQNSINTEIIKGVPGGIVAPTMNQILSAISQSYAPIGAVIALAITRAQIPLVNITVMGLKVFSVSGFSAVGDLGIGAYYSSVGATSAGPMAIQDAGGTWFNLVINGPANVGWFGATGTSTGTAGTGTDDSAAFQLALNAAATVSVPEGYFRIAATIKLNNGNILVGVEAVGDGAVDVSQLVGDNGITVLQAKYYSSLNNTGVQIRNLYVSGGIIGLNQTPSEVYPITSASTFTVTEWKIEGCTFFQTGTGGASIQCSTAFERCEFDCILGGNDYGLQLIARGNLLYNYMDKNILIINAVDCNINGINISASRACVDNTWIRLNITNIGKNGFVSNCPMVGNVFISPYTELIGLDGPTTANTTGTISIASNSLVVASVVNLAVGQQLTIAGAGVNGADLYGFIPSTWNGVSTTILLVTATGGSTPANAGTAVTSQQVTNNLYDEFYFNYANGAPQNITFIGGFIGQSAKTRYSINILSGYSFQYINPYSPAAINDPTWCLTMQGGWSGGVRSANNIGQVPVSGAPYYYPSGVLTRAEAFLYTNGGVLTMRKSDGTFHTITTS